MLCCDEGGRLRILRMTSTSQLIQMLHTEDHIRPHVDTCITLNMKICVIQTTQLLACKFSKQDTDVVGIPDEWLHAHQPGQGVHAQQLAGLQTAEHSGQPHCTPHTAPLLHLGLLQRPSAGGEPEHARSGPSHACWGSRSR